MLFTSGFTYGSFDDLVVVWTAHFVSYIYCCFLLFPPFGLDGVAPVELVELVEADGVPVFGDFPLVFGFFPWVVAGALLLFPFALGLPGWGLLGAL